MEPCTQELEVAFALPQHWRKTRLLLDASVSLLPNTSQPKDIRFTVLKCRDGPADQIITKSTTDLPLRPLWAALLLETL